MTDLFPMSHLNPILFSDTASRLKKRKTVEILQRNSGKNHLLKFQDKLRKNLNMEANLMSFFSREFIYFSARTFVEAFKNDLI